MVANSMPWKFINLDLTPIITFSKSNNDVKINLHQIMLIKSFQNLLRHAFCERLRKTNCYGKILVSALFEDSVFRYCYLKQFSQFCAVIDK